MAFISLTPTMKSNTYPAPYRAFGQGLYYGSYDEPWCVFGDDIYTETFLAINGIVGLDFSKPVCIDAVKIRTKHIHNYASIDYLRVPIKFYIQGSKDGTTWLTLSEMDGNFVWSKTEFKTFIFKNEISYRYYRICIAASGYEQVCLSGVVFGRNVKMLIDDNGIKTINSGIIDIEEKNITSRLFKTHGFDDINKLFKTCACGKILRGEDIMFKHNYKMASIKVNKTDLREDATIEINNNIQYIYPDMKQNDIVEQKAVRCSSGNNAYNAFTPSHTWRSRANDQTPTLLESFIAPQIINAISITSGEENYGFTGFTISVSRNDGPYKEIYSVSNIEFKSFEEKTFKFNNTTAYNTYRITFHKRFAQNICEVKYIRFMFDEESYLNHNGDYNEINFPRSTSIYRAFLYFDQKYYTITNQNELMEINIDDKSHQYIAAPIDLKSISEKGTSIYNQLPKKFELRVLHDNNSSIKAIVGQNTAPINMLSDNFKIITACQGIDNINCTLNASMQPRFVIQNKPLDLSFIKSIDEIVDLSIVGDTTEILYALSLDSGQTWYALNKDIHEIDITTCDPLTEMASLSTLNIACLLENDIFKKIFNKNKTLSFAFYLTDIKAQLESIAIKIALDSVYVNAIKHTDFKYSLANGVKLNVKFLATGDYTINYTVIDGDMGWSVNNHGR